MLVQYNGRVKPCDYILMNVTHHVSTI